MRARGLLADMYIQIYPYQYVDIERCADTLWHTAHTVDVDAMLPLDVPVGFAHAAQSGTGIVTVPDLEPRRS